MAKKKKKKSLEKENNDYKKPKEEDRDFIKGGIFLFLFLLFFFSLFEKSGILGSFLKKIFFFLIGKGFYFLPPFLLLISIAFFFAKGLFEKKLFILSTLGILGISAFLNEGRLGHFFSLLFFKLLGFPLYKIFFFFLFSLSFYFFWDLLKTKKEEEKEKISLFQKIFAPRFKVLTLEKEKKKVEIVQPKEEEEKEILVKKGRSSYQIPLDLLEEEKDHIQANNLEKNIETIKKTLENFGIEVQMGPVNVGPTVTQYTLKPAEGTKLSKISMLNRELSLALAAHPIRIEAPIPGKSLVGIEVPNKARVLVRIKKMLQAEEFKKDPSALTVCLGKNVAGEFKFANLAKMPHLLVAGATGTGKTIFLNSLIVSLVFKHPPDFLRVILIDPKRVEFSFYQYLPHLVPPIIFDANKVIATLNWLTEEMERRFEILGEKRARNIAEFNHIAKKERFPFLPYLVLVIDELADLMALKPRELEALIVKLAQKSRAVGIHLVLATQRPSVDVLTGLIKANITHRIAFQVPSQVDSRTILDTAGAERLLGAGDLLYLSPEFLKPIRIQAPYISSKEVQNICQWLEENVEIKQDDEIKESLALALEKKEEELSLFDENEEDPFYPEAERLVLETGKASASFLQRRLKIGYARAARLLDMMEKKGIVGPAQGAKPREVYGREKNDYNEI